MKRCVAAWSLRIYAGGAQWQTRQSVAVMFFDRVIVFFRDLPGHHQLPALRAPPGGQPGEVLPGGSVGRTEDTCSTSTSTSCLEGSPIPAAEHKREREREREKRIEPTRFPRGGTRKSQGYLGFVSNSMVESDLSSACQSNFL